MVPHPDPLTHAAEVLDRAAKRLEVLACGWREEATYMRKGDHSLLGAQDGAHERYVRAASSSLLRSLTHEARAVARMVETAFPAPPEDDA